MIQHLPMPVHDWQFWVVTIIALVAALYLLRNVLPRRLSPFRTKGRGVKTTLTIGGKAPGPTKPQG